MSKDIPFLFFAAGLR